MDTTETIPDHYRLTHQQQRFCDEYLTHFNAFKAAVNSGYSENTSRKGALLHVPKIQYYLKQAMNRRSQRLEITHDMILRELSKIAFSNMGNYYDEYACLKRMNELTADEKAAISFYDITEVQDGEGYRVGMQSRIKLHNKMSALDKIARHLDFYGTLGVKKNQESRIKSQDEEGVMAESSEDGLLVITPTKAAGGEEEVAAAVAGESEGGGLKREAFCGRELESREDVLGHGAENTPLTSRSFGTGSPGRGSRFEGDSVVVDRSVDNLPMDYPVEDFELEGIDLKTLMALEDMNISPGRPRESLESEVGSLESGTGSDEKMENILTISPLPQLLNDRMIDGLNVEDRFVDGFALGIAADTGQAAGSGQAPAAGSGQAVAKASRWDIGTGCAV
ncbi:terminase small subunit [Mucilaginibacter sp. AW1-3]